MDTRNRKTLQRKRQRKGEGAIYRNKGKRIGVESVPVPPGASEVLTSQADMANPQSKFTTPVPTCSSAPSGVITPAMSLQQQTWSQEPDLVMIIRKYYERATANKNKETSDRAELNDGASDGGSVAATCGPSDRADVNDTASDGFG